jgi:hypothetical protein
VTKDEQYHSVLILFSTIILIGLLIESELHSIIIDVCESGWNLGFMDFFVDEYIRDIGNILNIQEYD